MNKIQYGQFFTERNVFENNSVFQEFMSKNELWNKNILEPFAGANNLIRFLQEKNQKLKYESFDLEPKNSNVKKNDSINNWFYKDFDLIVTNPPYLSKHSARRMKIDADFQNYDDLYKLSLDRCISNVRFTVAIIPTTLINSNRKEDQKLIEKLVIFQLLPDKENFNDTEHPVALAYFDNLKDDGDFLLYENNKFIDSYKNLRNKEQKILKQRNEWNIRFNVVSGNLCINTGDNTKDKTNIKFHDSEWKSNDQVKSTDRHKVKLLIEDVEVDEELIEAFNKKIQELRNNHCDYLWASFKGVSRTGHFRKRLDFETAKKIINSIQI
ncbi:hypothetical protein NPA13_02165 [Mycoplasma sp. 2045]|uniref:Eco57I restriction-modification methylase domain-containing protein n=1 Tax=Mycoplasma sp. 2045 TaxID=2967301 RepID=UPI00211CF05D|nr:hypothetical protein [Mycoplasma sp. 2045]UUM20248.1 hypothetical protein NPA13_02165 [Mycoplasma sp. 2045]